MRQGKTRDLASNLISISGSRLRSYVFVYGEIRDKNKENKRSMKSKISKILGIGLTAGLVLGLIGAVFAAPVSADVMKWGKVSTPDMGDMVILPASDILDYDIGGDGDTIYAVLRSRVVTG